MHLTHRCAGRFQDRLGFSAVHCDLLQRLQALLAQLLPVPDKLGQLAVCSVVAYYLDQLRKVVAIPLTEHKNKKGWGWLFKTNRADHPIDRDLARNPNQAGCLRSQVVICLSSRLNAPKNGVWYPSSSYTASAIRDAVCGKRWEVAKSHNTAMHTQVPCCISKMC